MNFITFATTMSPIIVALMNSWKIIFIDNEMRQTQTLCNVKVTNLFAQYKNEVFREGFL